MTETSDEWITKRTGIKTRYISTGESTWQMAVNASQQALSDAEIKAENLQAIISVTATPDYYYPNLSCIVSNQVGAVSPLTIDVNCACSGFIYGLDLAKRYLLDDDIQNVLIVCSELTSKITDYSDRLTCVLFADGAGALVLSKGNGLFSACLKSKADKIEALFSKTHAPKNPWTNNICDDGLFPNHTEPYIYMNGSDIYKFATNVAPSIINEACASLSLCPHDLNLIIPHQANLRIIEAISKKMNIPIEKFACNVQNYGNTCSASIPICLHEQIKVGRVKKGDKIGMVGFGAGLTYAACVLEII
jgi:3-oxoacyl-[acyl-carrier-protein] synthase-3